MEERMMLQLVQDGLPPLVERASGGRLRCAVSVMPEAEGLREPRLVRVNLSGEALSGSAEVRWLVPQGNLLRDVHGTLWGLPLILRQATEGGLAEPGVPEVERYKAEFPADLDRAVAGPSWWWFACARWRRLAGKAARGTIRQSDVAGLEGRLNAPFAAGSDLSGKLRAALVPEDANLLKELEASRRVEINFWGDVNGRIRRPHHSHRGRLCPFHTPESRRIGLQLFRSADAEMELREGLPRFAPSGKESLLFSAAVGLVPYVGHTDGPRLLMGGKNLKQAVPHVEGAEPPLVPGVYEGHRGTEIFDGRYYSGTRFAQSLGVNALVAVAPYGGYTYEDGLVVSRRLAERLAFRDRCRQTELLPLEIGRDQIEGPLEFAERIVEEMRFYVGESYQQQQKLPLPAGGGMVPRTPDDRRPRYERRVPGTLEDVTVRLVVERWRSSKENKAAGGDLIEDPEKDGKGGKKKKKAGKSKAGLSLELTYVFEVDRPLEVGDKLSGRHGNKGVVTRILDDPPTARLGGRDLPVELMISPCSILGRKNFGQIAEMVHGLALQFPDALPHRVKAESLYGGAEWQALLEEMTEPLGLNPDGTAKVSMEGGEQDIFVGRQYICRLEHHAEDKLQARGTAGPLREHLGQPDSGGPRAGQRFGEMENWSLLSRGGVTGADAEALLAALRTHHMEGDKGGALMEELLFGLGVAVTEEEDRSLSFGYARAPREQSAAQVCRQLEEIAGGSGPERPPRMVAAAPCRGEERDKKIAPWEDVAEVLRRFIVREGEAGNVSLASVSRLRSTLPGDPVYRPILDALDACRKPGDEPEEEPEAESGSGGDADGGNNVRVDLSGLQLLRLRGPGGEPRLPVLPGVALWNSDLRTATLRCCREWKAVPALTGRTAREGDDWARRFLHRLKALYESLARLMEGKEGLLRRHLLGKRLPHSGRAVIVPEPSLPLEEVRVPVAMLVEMLQRHGALQRLGISPNLLAGMLRRSRNPGSREELAEELEERLEAAPLWGILVRQPSLHRHSVQAFRLRVWNREVIGIPPLVTPGYNADFDGDSMAVFLPPEPWGADLSAYSILRSPGRVADGALQLEGKLDLALGWGALAEKKRQEWTDAAGVETDAQLGGVLAGLTARGDLHGIATLQSEVCRASSGAASLAPGEFRALRDHLAEALAQGELRTLRREIAGAGHPGDDRASAALQAKARELEGRTEDLVEQWLADHPDSHLYRLVEGKAKGSPRDLRQLTAFLGRQEPEGQEENPDDTSPFWIDGNLWDGLSDDELFRYSYASRESMASKKLAVAESGYLSRQLAEGMYNTLAEGDDCGTERGLSVTCSGGRLWVAALGDTTADPPLALFGSLSAEKPEDDILKRLAAGRVPVGGDRPLTDGDCEALAAYWEGRGDPPEILRVHLAEHDGALALRSPLTCAAGPGRVCRRCMGADLAGRPIWGAAPELVPEGAPVGLTAAQAIGERGTQLAMRRFHQVGGTGSERDRVRELRELLVWGKPLRGAKAPYEECALRGLRELSAILSEEGGERPFGELPQSLVHFELAVKTALDAPGGKLERTVPAEMQHAWLEVASYESFQGVLRSIPARESAAGLKSRVLLNRSGKERDHG